MCSCDPGWITPTPSRETRVAKETMTVCRDCSCSLDRICSCDRDPDPVVYHPPVGRCFNPASFYPGDTLWGEFDIIDTCETEEVKDNVVTPPRLVRRFFNTTGMFWYQYAVDLA